MEFALYIARIRPQELTINENADPDVVHDMLFGLDKASSGQGKRFYTWRGKSCGAFEGELWFKAARLLL